MTHALLLALALSAPEGVTLERGKQLFGDIDLGANGKTCVQCHAGGKSFDPDELKAASPKDLGTLTNHCLTLRMKSAKLSHESVELQSLVMYVKTFAARGR